MDGYFQLNFISTLYSNIPTYETDKYQVDIFYCCIFKSLFGLFIFILYSIKKT
jgi:hypothetical protein